MRLDHAFVQLPVQLDAERLATEVRHMAAEAWLPHPQGHAGNTAVPLIAVAGDPFNNGTHGPMLPTQALAQLPYVRQLLAALHAPIGRSRLMRIAPGAQATRHVDLHYYWAERTRVHVPIQSSPEVIFQCGDASVCMAPGQAWIFDTWREHNVRNPTARDRIHLVVDTVGSDVFWQQFDGPTSIRHIPFDATVSPQLVLEANNQPAVMSPWEMRHLLGLLAVELHGLPGGKEFLAAQVRFIEAWRALWSTQSEPVTDVHAFTSLQKRWQASLAAWPQKLTLSNQIDAAAAVNAWLVQPALAAAKDAGKDIGRRPHVTLTETTAGPLPGPPPAPTSSVRGRPRGPGPVAAAQVREAVFIVSAPRSGSSVLFETLARAPAAFTVGGESHNLIEAIHPLAPQQRDFSSNALGAEDATPAVVAELHGNFVGLLRDRKGVAPLVGQDVCLLEKTPKNVLRVPFLAAAFPQSRFIFLLREAAPNIGSIMDAWLSGAFVTYPDLPDWSGPPWSLLLIPNWRALAGAPLAAIAAAQWESANQHMLAAMDALPADRCCTVRYEDFLAQPNAEAERLAAFARLGWDCPVVGPLPPARHTLTAPRANKWLRHRTAIAAVLPSLDATQKRLSQRFVPSSPSAPRSAVAGEASVVAPEVAFSPPAPQAAASPMRSIHTTSLPRLLRELHAAVFVSTYQAGKVVILRSQDDVLNTHFCDFQRPMGIAMGPQGLVIGTQRDVQRFVNMPDVARKLPDANAHDACFLPRSVHTTGDIQVHDLAWGAEGVWCVNTSFSCLSTLSMDASFVPRWRPRCVTALTPEDRCHLNGLAMVDGKPRFVTTLGLSDEAAGWRARKRDGGVVIDVHSDEVVATGLCMPHSPRWHAGRLWVLNSGEGGIGTIDLSSGRYQEVARLPGFTRGLSFHGRFAFIGLSQIRETATFGEIPVAALPLNERRCGVWVVDVTTGQTVAFAQFESGVEEIFAVELAHRMRYPEILTDNSLIERSYMLPDAAMRDVPNSQSSAFGQ